ncbi:hypothetical protein IJ579_03380 [bacterium]|nr:hypothetical protein [bacterium]
MKKLLISLLLITPLFAGCTNIETRITINDDRSAQVVSSLTYNGNLADKSDENSRMILANYQDFLNSDYDVHNAFGSRLSTITGSKKIDNIFLTDIDLSSLGFKSNLPSGKFLDIKKNFLVTSYNVNLEFDYPEILSQVNKVTDESEKNIQMAMEPEYLQKYGDADEMLTDSQSRKDFVDNLDESAIMLDKKSQQETIDEADKPINPKKQEPKDDYLKMSFSVELPSYAYFNNADSTDGSIYTWNIRKDSPTVIKLQYVHYSGFAVLFIVLLGIALLVYLAYRILRHDSRKRVGTNN